MASGETKWRCTKQCRVKNSEVGKWLHYCFGLLFLNPEEVEDFYFFELYTKITK